MSRTLKQIREEAAANSIAAGGVAGLTGDPPVSLVNQQKHKFKILRRSKKSQSDK